MGERAPAGLLARIFERADAVGLVGIDSRRSPRFDMGDPVLRAARRIKESVEHAARAAILDLEAIAFADLERRLAEAADQLVRGEPDQDAAFARLLGLRDDRRRGNLGLRDPGAGGDREEWDGGKEDTHRPATMPKPRSPGKVARSGRDS